jgi:hypothetical protein
MIKLISLLAPLSMIALGACAAPEAAPYAQYAQSRAPQCFRVNEVYSFSEAGDGAVNLQTAQGPFRMQLGPGCPDFSWFMEIGIRPMESSWLCEGKSDVLITGSPIPGNACAVGSIERLEPGALALTTGWKPAA